MEIYSTIREELERTRLGFYEILKDVKEKLRDVFEPVINLAMPYYHITGRFGITLAVARYDENGLIREMFDFCGQQA